MNRTAKLLGVVTPSVQTSIGQFAKEPAAKPEPEGQAVAKKSCKLWVGKA